MIPARFDHFRNILIISILSILTSTVANAQTITIQETMPASNAVLTLTQHTAVTMFVKNNYSVLIDKYNVSKASASMIQAGAYPNPTLYGNNTQMEISNGQILDNNIVRAIGLNETFKLGGKRELSMDIASHSLDAANYIHKDTTRTLLINFISLYYQCVIDKAAADQGKTNLDYFAKIMEIEENRKKYGAISDLEYFRLITQQTDYYSAYYNAQTQYNNDIKNLKTALRIDNDIDVTPGISIEEVLDYKPDLAEFKKAALNRYNIQALKKQLEADKKNLDYQNAQNIPDITAGLEYDTTGTTADGRRMPPMFGATLSLNLPIFDRNTGGISSAEYAIKQDELALANATMSANTEVEQAYDNFITSQTIFNEYHKRDMEIERMHENVKQSYASKGSLLYLLDFERTYKIFSDSYRTAYYNLMLKKALLDLYTGGIML